MTVGFIIIIFAIIELNGKWWKEAEDKTPDGGGSVARACFGTFPADFGYRGATRATPLSMFSAHGI